MAFENGELSGEPFLFEVSSRAPRFANDRGVTYFRACVGRLYPEPVTALELSGTSGDMGFVDVNNFASFPDVIKAFAEDKEKYISGEKSIQVL